MRQERYNAVLRHNVLGPRLLIVDEIGYLPLRPAIVTDPKYLAGWIAEHPLVAPNLEQLDRLEELLAADDTIAVRESAVAEIEPMSAIGAAQWLHNRRTKRCATIPRTVAPTRKDSTPMSARRKKAVALSLVCSVEKTRCPVSED